MGKVAWPGGLLQNPRQDFRQDLESHAVAVPLLSTYILCDGQLVNVLLQTL